MFEPLPTRWKNTVAWAVASTVPHSRHKRWCVSRLGKLHEDGSTLQVEIAEAEEQRAKLREEEIQAVPVRQAVTNEKQVRWLKKYTQEAAEKRAFLLEEISFEQARESRFQLEASVRREEAVLEESHLGRKADSSSFSPFHRWRAFRMLRWC